MNVIVEVGDFKSAAVDALVVGDGHAAAADAAGALVEGQVVVDTGDQHLAVRVEDFARHLVPRAIHVRDRSRPLIPVWVLDELVEARVVGHRVEHPVA